MRNHNLKLLPGTGQISVKHDIDLAIATGKSRFETSWKNGKASWSSLLSRLSRSVETPETHSEYLKMGKEKQDAIKDIGGFVGGHLTGGKRRNGSVLSRQAITLDLDFAPEGFVKETENNLDVDYAWCIYSTHKHGGGMNRFRLVIPLSREVTPDEYEAAARKVAEEHFNIEWFDDTTFQPTRLMFWPSHSIDTKPVFAYQDEEPLNPDSILDMYPNWQDTSFWAYSSRVDGLHRKAAEKAGDPLSKPGIIGAFCRAYTVPEAIETYLGGVYGATSKEDRYTYMAGSTAAGLVIYGGGLFAFSNHSTDPASGRLCNAFDLVRLHRFGHLDAEAAPDTPASKLPSFKEMQGLAKADKKVVTMIAKAKEEQARADFAPLEEEEDWRERLAVKKNGELEPTLSNARLILSYDPALQSIRKNESTGFIEADPDEVPWGMTGKYWKNDDNDCLYTWVAVKYGVQFPSEQFYRALTDVAVQRKYHPVRDYLDGLPPWDGKARVDTLLLDYFVAEDSVYTREAMRKTLVAAVARIYEPGKKFDNMLVLDGSQGTGKTTFFGKLGGEWYNENLTLADMKDKSGAEKLQGYWILEVGELAGMRKIDKESVKAFLSRREDIYRPAFGRTTERHPRECVIVGTVNGEDGFLRDITGNRRFWPVRVAEGRQNVWKMPDAEVAQIWAEALTLYRRGEPLTLSREAEEIARSKQSEAMETDPRQPLVEKYLETPLPEGWDDMSVDDRLQYLDDDDEFYTKGNIKRQTVSNLEIWVECFRMKKSAMERRDTEAITGIMRRISGWERGGMMRTKLYGRQKIYKRKREWEP